MFRVTTERRYIPRYRRVHWSTVVRAGRYGRRVEIWPFPSKDEAQTFTSAIRTIFAENRRRGDALCSE